MTNKDTKVRVAKAFRAMKELGIPDFKVKPVLKNLLMLYDKDWTLIEEENYRALADAIFDKDESEAGEQSKKIVKEQMGDKVDSTAPPHSPTSLNAGDVLDEETPQNQVPQRPLKRLRHGHHVGEASSSKTPGGSMPGAPLLKPKEEADVLPVSHLSKLAGSEQIELTRENGETNPMNLPDITAQGKQSVAVASSISTSVENFNSCQPSGTRNIGSISHQMTLRDREKEPASTQVPSRKKRPAPENSSLSVSLKEPKAEPSFSPKEKIPPSLPLLKPKDEPMYEEIISPDVNGTIGHPNLGGDSLNEPKNCRESCNLESAALGSGNDKEAVTDTSQNEHGNCSEVPMDTVKQSASLEIAASPSGAVKMFLRVDLNPENGDFCMPNLESVIKSVEEKCLQPHRVLDNSISLSNLLRETCLCFLELGTSSSCGSPEASHVTEPNEGVNKSSDVGVQEPSGFCFNAQNDSSGGCQLMAEVPGGPNLQEASNMAVDDEIVKYGDDQNGFTKEFNDQILDIQPLNSILDIAKGEEKIVITVVNEVNDELPPPFCYIPQNAVFQNAHVNFCLARIGDQNCCVSCSGDCLSSSLSPCACLNENGGEFAYTTDGLVKEKLLRESISMNRDPKKHCQYFCKECPLERSKCDDTMEPCKGHLVRKFIKECWWKCGCGKQCGNRVVQRGITRKLQVFMTPEGKGWGLRTLEDLPKGAFVCEYVGEVLTSAELFERVSRSRKKAKHSYPVLLDADWCAEGVLKDEEALCLDATHYGNVARFINHRCYDSNLVEIPVEIETPDHHYYHLAFFTIRKVKATEELTWDYGIDFDDHEHPIKAFQCQCGSRFCRNIKRTRTRSSRR